MSDWSLRVRPYAEADAQAWDRLVGDAPMATFLHSRRFLSHHGDRFADRSSVLLDAEGELVGVVPAAADPADDQRVVSHPGATYGGLVHRGNLYGQRMIDAVEALRSHYGQLGFRTLRYKAVPYIYHRAPCSDDLYALFRCGGVRSRADLSCAIDLEQRREPSARRKRALKKAHVRGVEVGEGVGLALQLWPVLERNLADRHDARPVHTLDEIEHLHVLFPENVAFVAAMMEGEVTAGVVLFRTATVVHAQYIASDERGREVGALDAVFARAIEDAARSGARYFDFGTSNEDEGRHLNAGLYQFKAEFGAGGMVQEFYDLPIAPKEGTVHDAPAVTAS